MSIGSQWGHLISFVQGKDATTATGLFCWIDKNEQRECVCVCARTGAGQKKSSLCVYVCAHVGGKLGV